MGLLAFALAGCTTQVDRDPFTISFVLDTIDGGCEFASCDDFDMSCGAVLSLRVVDVDQNRVVDSVCEQAQPSTSLCDITLDIEAAQSVLFDIPQSMLRIEVAIWAPETLEADDGTIACPNENIFDLSGVPLASYQPQPAFAGASFFDATESDVIAPVRLTCSDPEQVGSCLLPQTFISSSVFDVERLLPVGDLAADDLIVRAAQPTARVEGEETVFVIDTAFALARDPGAEVRFSAFVPGQFADLMCSLVLKDAAQAVTAVSCTSIGSNLDQIDLDGLFLDKTRLDLILSAALLSTFPEQGLVVGRVVDEVGLALPGVTVIATGLPPSAIEYLDSSGTMFFGDRTSDTGYFIARDVPFGTRFTATHTDGRTENGEYIGGLVQGVATTLLIEVTDDDIVVP